MTRQVSELKFHRSWKAALAAGKEHPGTSCAVDFRLKVSTDKQSRGSSLTVLLPGWSSVGSPELIAQSRTSN